MVRWELVVLLRAPRPVHSAEAEAEAEAEAGPALVVLVGLAFSALESATMIGKVATPITSTSAPLLLGPRPTLAAKFGVLLTLRTDTTGDGCEG